GLEDVDLGREPDRRREAYGRERDGSEREHHERPTPGEPGEVRERGLAVRQQREDAEEPDRGDGVRGEREGRRGSAGRGRRDGDVPELRDGRVADEPPHPPLGERRDGGDNDRKRTERGERDLPVERRLATARDRGEPQHGAGGRDAAEDR